MPRPALRGWVFVRTEFRLQINLSLLVFASIQADDQKAVGEDGKSAVGPPDFRNSVAAVAVIYATFYPE